MDNRPESKSEYKPGHKPEYKKKPIRSYVVRAGRMTDGQKAAFNRFWPSYGLSLRDGMIEPQTLFGRNAPLVLEVGFGMGASLQEMLQAEPEKDFIGIEVHPPGVGRLISEVGKLDRHNLRVYLADAIDVLDDCIPADSLSRLQLYFPDPWHKKKHNKRRIVQSGFVQKIRTRLAIGGVFHMATDWQPYAEHMMQVMSEAEGYENLAGVGEYSPRPAYRPITKFEKRGERLGHGVWDLLFRRVA